MTGATNIFIFTGIMDASFYVEKIPKEQLLPFLVPFKDAAKEVDSSKATDSYVLDVSEREIRMHCVQQDQEVKYSWE